MKSTNNKMLKFINEAITLYSQAVTSDENAVGKYDTKVIEFVSLTVIKTELKKDGEGIISIEFQMEIKNQYGSNMLRNLIVNEIETTVEATNYKKSIVKAKWLNDYFYKTVEAPGRRW